MCVVSDYICLRVTVCRLRVMFCASTADSGNIPVLAVSDCISLVCRHSNISVLT